MKRRVRSWVKLCDDFLVTRLSAVLLSRTDKKQSEQDEKTGNS